MSEITINQEESDLEYQALKVIEDLERDALASSSAPSQRDFARALNLSVGMTNAIIKRLVGKGWLVMNRINGRNLSYALTPDGTRELARRSYRYLRRTIGNVVRWKDAIDRVVLRGKEAGCDRVLLIGDSDLDFIVEHAAGGMGWCLFGVPDPKTPVNASRMKEHWCSIRKKRKSTFLLTDRIPRPFLRYFSIRK
jgi:predicted transcriptional regulator